ncbi:MAG TPA: tetratricopeptide repeat protein [Stellaceae bacterium]|nr:tetratricopeptide repeat protein [Stellaceae bacterium]
MARTKQAISEALEHGLAHHRVGRLREAEACYRQLLSIEPRHPDGLHLLGVVAQQAGRNDLAVTYIGQAIAVMAKVPDYHANMGNALAGLGRLPEAEASYRKALRLRPGFAMAHGNLGNVLQALERPEEAEASFRNALRLHKNYPEAQHNLGNLLRGMGRAEEAEACYRTAIALNPDYTEAHNNLGTLQVDAMRLAEAEACFQATLRLDPRLFETHYNLGNVLRRLDRPDDALASYRTALQLKPDFVDARVALAVLLHLLGREDEAETCYRDVLALKPDLPIANNNLGNLLLKVDRMAEAEACYRVALAAHPEFPEAHYNLGLTLHALGRDEEPETYYRTALRLKPEYPEAHYALALRLLATGRLAEGWQEYEWRWKVAAEAGTLKIVDYGKPRWTGEPLGDRVLLVHAEQGFGDTLQFCRYLPMVAARGRVVLQVQPALVTLLSGIPGIERLIADGDPLPDFDLECPMLSLPLACGTTLETIPAMSPYLTAEPTRAMHWRERLADLPGLRVGLHWSGDPRRYDPNSAAIDRRRSMALRALADLGGIDGVSFVSLQKGEPARQAAQPPAGMVLHDWTNELTDFADTAGLIDGLDLVIGVDTAVSHLAGALGKPIWLLNRYDTCWRWLLDRDDSPWYPSLRQFRQPHAGDWPSVVRNVREALDGLVAARH